MTPVARNRLFALGALLVAGAGLGFVAFGNIGENLVYYWSPSEMLAQGEKAYSATIRLGGVVQPGSIQWNAEHTTLHFRVANDAKEGTPSVLVRSTETPPQMFRDKIGVVVEGTYDASGVFSSNRLMVNHSNEYRAPKEGEDPNKWRETLSEGTTTASTGTGAEAR
ncbi:cytochrome c maturation protein CcmE [Myxococcus llanfairpwllgwyngyllgogerychwyrndrobwllllantysiliogogogochensis]|uniref:Cytochrome c maturation protein CcmE n=1 Tax=Myxococcus llanfairpwllgwyngyllgogerychwyrndrobwllllantysiliogogogochensis TaxID=2590453 RepID=A0A540X2X4_9BACT|nr:cytochrome c maturation protein CcmE [Myxococcus llanfairpwllgwyngyllgogerychwyrndrobwllllantysiliogogogochensis]TQF15034.1 cytochrome c maturation protein CcmE [Myxococcus llanfairpwllgwyngyllgogerychwyrndrobwllllantysiliogogogochensis]